MSRKLFFVFLCSFGIFLLNPPTLQAEEEVMVIEQTDNFSDLDEPETKSLNAEEQVDQIQHLFFKTVGLLAGLCGLIIGGGYLLKRLGGAKIGTFGNGEHITLVERKYISPKTALWLVTANGQPFIIVDGQEGVAIHPCNTSLESTES